MRVVCGMGLKKRTEEKVGEESSGKQAFKVNRGEIAEGLVNAASVIEQQVFCNRVFSLFSAPKMCSIDALNLESLEERFGAGIVVGDTRTAHALDAADGGDLAPEVP